VDDNFATLKTLLERPVSSNGRDRGCAGWTIERVGAAIAVRDVWTENEDHAAWLVATKVGLPLERVTVWAGRDA
jgi:hypothetical protein